MDNPSNDKPPHDAQAYQVSEERRRWVFFAILTIMFMIGGFLIFLTAYKVQFKSTFDSGVVLGLYASTLALLLASAYFYAFKFFDDLFYLFLAIGWLANACYLPFEFLFDSQCIPGQPVPNKCFEFLLYTFAISFVSSISFYSSTLIKPKDSFPSSWTTLGLCAVSVAVLTGVGYLLFNTVWPAGGYALKFVAYTAPGALFAAYGLFRVGRHITGALKTPKMSSSRTLNVLSLTFYLYALLQLTYPLKIYLIEARVRWIFTSFFVIAFAIKLTNIYCLIRVLLTVKYPEFVQQQAELTALQERLSRQSELEAIGAIAASIEHDIKTPLAGISTKLAAMRRRYSDDKIREYIERLEADKNRITAIAKVVPYMRAAKDFWDRDEFMRKVSMVELINLAIKAVKVEMSLDTDKFYLKLAPSSDPRLSIRAYNPMLEQMLVNLLKNGIEAIREAGKDHGAISVRIAAVRAVPKEAAGDYDLKGFTRWVRVEIEDNGCGIPPENIPKVTSLFTTKYERKPNGGIGLYIAKRLIQIHGGCIGITSVVGKGTIVTLYLPEWEAYQHYALGHPDALKQSYDFDDDIAALHVSDGDRQETHAIAE